MRLIKKKGLGKTNQQCLKDKNGLRLRHCAPCCSYLSVTCVSKLFKTGQRQKRVEMETCLTKQANVFVWKGGLSERNLEIRARWLHFPLAAYWKKIPAY